MKKVFYSLLMVAAVIWGFWFAGQSYKKTHFTGGELELYEALQTACAGGVEARFEKVLELQEDVAVLRQLWGQAPLLNHRVELHWDDAGVRLSGRRLTGEPSAAGGGGGRSVPTALMDIFTGLNRLGDVCSQITRIQPSYVSMSTLHGFITLRPVWHITTDTGVYQLDTVSGQLSRSAA